ncbi:MAG: hypothetical protein ACLQBB_13680 [Solirubrobacteraceae bacterium]
MRRLRVLGLTMLVACAAGSMLVATASAGVPEIGKCQAVEGGSGGKYTDAACTQKARRSHGQLTGGFEWAPLEHLERSGGRRSPGKLTMQGSMVFETAAGKKIECETMTVASLVTLTGAKTARTPLWEFEGCSSEGQPCKDQEAPEEGEINNDFAWFEEPPTAENENGEIVPTGPAPGWRGSLGFITRGASPAVGMDYTVLNDERLFEPVKCEGAIGTVWIGGAKRGRDGIISTIGPLDVMTSKFTETYAESAPGIQSNTRLDGHHSSIEAFIENHWEPVALNTTLTYGFEEGGQFEIKAIR